jgi:hypothetical protein
MTETTAALPTKAAVTSANLLDQDGPGYGHCLESAPHKSFTDADFGRQSFCAPESDSDFFTAVIKYTPNGRGAYTGGILVGSLDAFGGTLIL